MIQQIGYKGNFYRGSDIGTRQYKQKINRNNQISNNSNFGFYMILFGIIILVILIYFNKKESIKKVRDNINDTVELIEKVANYNLETDLAKQQSIYSSQHSNLNRHNPSNEEIERHKRIAYLEEKKRHSDYLAKEFALDGGPNETTQSQNITNTHDIFYEPPQPIPDVKLNELNIGFNQSTMCKENNMMYNAHFGSKNYQNINSPFIHPEESIRPLPSQPHAFNNPLETQLPENSHASNFLEHIPSNVFKQDYFNTNQSYESPYLININKIQTYEQSNNPLFSFSPNNYTNF